jgi:uncharacterized protein (DUF2249 family)
MALTPDKLHEMIMEQESLARKIEQCQKKPGTVQRRKFFFNRMQLLEKEIADGMEVVLDHDPKAFYYEYGAEKVVAAVIENRRRLKRELEDRQKGISPIAAEA